MWQVAVKKDYDSGQYYDSETEVRGLLDYTDAYHDALWAEQLYALGVRTHRTLGIIMLKELVTTEGIESVELLQQRQLLPAGFMPVVQVRAFGTELRVSDLTVKPRFQEATLNDVYQLIGEELGITVSGENYLDWFAATLAKNMGRLHQAGLVHGSISAHNITLDCRLVDHDTMYRPRQHASSTQYAESSGDSIGRTAEEVLRSLCFLLGNGPRFEEVVLFYKEAYHRFMPRPARASVASEEEQTVA